MFSAEDSTERKQSIKTLNLFHLHYKDLKGTITIQ